MPRSFDATIPPEYRVMATQVTQYGEPVTAQITPSAYGSYGRAVQDSNDMHQAGMGAEVWNKGESPDVTSRNRAAAEVAQLRHMTRTGQINTPEVTNREGGAKVVYREMSGDQQVSNVRGLRVTGDPQTVARALKSAGNSSFESKTPMDAPRAKASMHRAVRSMSDTHRAAFQAVLARKGPEAFESIAPTALAGLNIENVGATPSGFVMPSQQAQLPQQQRQTKQTTAKKAPRKMVPIRLPISPRQTVAMRKAMAPKDEGSNPAAFDKLVAEASAKQQNTDIKTVAKFHPAASNFEDSTGQTNTRAGIKLAPAAKVAVLRKSAKELSKADKKISQALASAAKAWQTKKKQADQAQAQENTKKATMLMGEIRKLQQTIAELRNRQSQVKQGVTQVQQETIKAGSSGDISREDQRDIIIQLPAQPGVTPGAGVDPGFYQGDMNLPGMASGDGMSTVGEDGAIEPYWTGLDDMGMKTSTKFFIGGGVAAALGLGIYMFAR